VFQLLIVSINTESVYSIYLILWSIQHKLKEIFKLFFLLILYVYMYACVVPF